MVKDRLAQAKADARSAGWAKYIGCEQDERAMLEGCYVDERFGLYVCDFIERHLRLSEGEWAGQPMRLMPWQRDDIIMPLFSWLRQDGTRRFREADIWTAKKNGKSPFCSAFCNLFLLGDDEDGAKVYIVANDKNQADIVYSEAANMVDASPYLSGQLKVIRSRKRICYGNSAYIQARSADVKTSEGFGSHLVIVDELHAFDARGGKLLDSFRFSGAARRQPMLVKISTAGDDQSFVARDEYDRAKRVKAGIDIDTEHFVYICEAAPGDDWTKPETWKKANPSIGVTIKLSELQAQCEKAKSSPHLQSVFKRYRCNIWVGHREPWLDADEWVRLETFDDESALAGSRATGGLDLAEKRDIAAWVIAFKNADGKTGFLPRFWLPEEGIEELEKTDVAPYRRFAEEGWLTLCPGARIDQTMIYDKIMVDAKRFGISQIGYDQWQATILVKMLTEKGLTMIEIPQTGKGMSDPSKEFESLIASGMAIHNNNPIMNRMIGQVTKATDTNANIRPVKVGQKKRMKIDGVVAAIMALRVMMAQPGPVKIEKGIIWV